MNRFVIAYAVSLGIITWDEVKTCHNLPWPPRFVGAAIVFGMIDIVGALNEELANIFAIGFVAALLIKSIPGRESLTTQQLYTKCNHAGGTAQPSSMSELTGSLPENTLQPPGGSVN